MDSSQSTCVTRISGSLAVALAVGPAFAHGDAFAHVSVSVGFGFAPPVYASAPVHVAPPRVYYAPPPSPAAVDEAVPVVYGENRHERAW
ncbi:hypothetical protein [Caballeronia grimmiae]|uniref:hypothetical protein n=1 Tax=Caballeronia grimmiae TaxID=1071679 RepID=UPI0038B70C06